MSTLLLGSETLYPDEQSVDASADEGFKFVAVASGTLDTLEIYVTATSPTAHDVYLSIYSDSGDAPAARLASGSVDAAAGAPGWVAVTGLSVAITAGTAYWLAATPLDGHFSALKAFAGGRDVVTNNTSPYVTPPEDPWRGIADTNFSYNHGPVAFRGMAGGPGGPGVEPEPDVLAMRDSGLEWHITGLWHPDDTSVAYYGRIADPSEDGVVIELDMQRTARVTLSTAEDVAQHVAPGLTYQRCLRAYYHGQLVYWAAINDRETDAAAGTITLASVDPSLRLQRHQLRRGDLLGTLTEANDDKGSVSVDHIGLRQLRDAGLNTSEQNDRGDPDLGIIDGTNDVPETPFNRIGVTRGDQVWNAMLQLSQSLGPDFELEPIEDTVGAYCKLNTYVHQGEDISALVALHWGCCNDNLENIRNVEGAKYTTHDHVLPRDIKGYRFTQANPQASAETGPYVDWDATDYDSEGIPADKVEDVLRAYGDDVLKAYGRPLQECILTLPIEDASSYLYLRDYRVGDTISVAARRDLYELDSSFYRITAVRLNHDGADDTVRVELQVIADRVAELGDAVAGAVPGDD